MSWKGILAGALMLTLALSSGIQGQTIAFDYTFKPDSEPDGFRHLKWQMDVAKLDPFNTMEVVEIAGSNVSYRKKHEDLKMGLANLEDIVYEFWTGRFAGVTLTTRGPEDYLRLKEYLFARFGPGARSQLYARMDVQDFTWNGYVTRMYLRYSDFDRVGELKMLSIAVLNQKRRYDNYYLRRQTGQLIRVWEQEGLIEAPARPKKPAAKRKSE